MPVNEPTPGLMAFDSTLHTRAATRLTPDQARAAARVVCDRTGSADAAVPVLQLLGLIDTPGGPVRRWDTIPVVHGTRSAVEWHESHPDPRMHALCQRCRDYITIQERSAKKRRERLRLVEGG